MTLKRFGLAVAVLGLTALAVAFARARLEDVDSRPCVAADATLTVGEATAAAATGQLVVANQFSGSATLIDLATGRRRTVFTGDGPHDAAISSDGRWAVVSNYSPHTNGRFGGRRLYVIDLLRAEVARVIDTGQYQGLHDVAFRPGFATHALVTAQTSGHVIEVDVASGEILRAIETRGDRSHLLAVTTDGRTVFTTNEGTATLSRLDLMTGAFVTTFPATENVEGIVVSGDGTELWVGHNRDGLVKVHDAANGEVLATFGPFRYPSRMAIAPDGRTIVISDPGCRVIVVADAPTRRIVRTLRTLDGVTMVGDIAPDNRTAFASLGDNREVIAIDLETARIVARHKTGWHPDGLGWAPLPVTRHP